MNVADLWEALAAEAPDAPTVVQADRRLTRAEFDRRANGIAAALLAAGLQRQDRVAMYLYNCPEYLESYVGATKAALVPVNTNYRYLDDELVYLWSNADAAAVVFHGTFAETIERVRTRVDTVRLWLWVDDGSGGCPDWATQYENAVGTMPATMPWSRSENDLVFVYTGGTTGIPKGVMWRQCSLVAPMLGRRRGGTIIPAPPLMHGTGMSTALSGLLRGATVALLAGRRFDAVELWSVAEQERVELIGVVGDAFARPMLDALDSNRGRWDLSSLRTIISAGAMFSEPVKRGLLRHVPDLRVIDQLGSSENASAATQRTVASNHTDTGTFVPMRGVRVIDEDGCDVAPGSGKVGVIAIPGGAEGYHKDPEKSARTFPMIDGRRYTVAGDYATVEADGTLRLLGRGSVCINTGGEKVFPEEVEETLKTHPAVRDAVVVGVPDDRFGEAITAVIEVVGDVRDDDLIDHVKSRIARYKAPRNILRVDSVGRAPNGKADYPAARALACAQLTPQGATT